MRNQFFDVLKFFAIMLVIYGHVSAAFSCEWGRPYVGNFIVGMNMPLFFIISGYFASKTIVAGDWVRLCKHICGYFWPVAVVSVVFASIVVAVHIPGCEKGFVGYAGRRFLFSPWFLWCLSFCYVATFLCCRFKHSGMKIGMLLLFIAGLMFLDGVWHAANVRAMLPHFLCGVFIFSRWELWKMHKIGAICLCVYIVVVFIQGDIWVNGMNFYNMKTTWCAFISGDSSFLLYLARIANGIVGSIGIMWFLHLLCNKIRCMPMVAPLGMSTLWVYILHQWILDRVVELGWYNEIVWSALFWVALLFMISHLCWREISCFQTYLYRKWIKA